MEAIVAYVEELQGQMPRGIEMEFIIHTFTCRRNTVMREKQGWGRGERRQEIKKVCTLYILYFSVITQHT